MRPALLSLACLATLTGPAAAVTEAQVLAQCDPRGQADPNASPRMMSLTLITPDEIKAGRAEYKELRARTDTYMRQCDDMPEGDAKAQCKYGVEWRFGDALSALLSADGRLRMCEDDEATCYRVTWDRPGWEEHRLCMWDAGMEAVFANYHWQEELNKAREILPR